MVQHGAMLSHFVRAGRRAAVFIADAAGYHGAALENHIDAVDCPAGRNVNRHDGCSRKPRL